MGTDRLEVSQSPFLSVPMSATTAVHLLLPVLGLFYLLLSAETAPSSIQDPQMVDARYVDDMDGRYYSLGRPRNAMMVDLIKKAGPAAVALGDIGDSLGQRVRPRFGKRSFQRRDVERLDDLQ